MGKHWKYAKYLARHKWFVFVAGLRTGAPLWRLIIHDWSKLLPCEWRPYANYFYGDSAVKTAWKNAFDSAWLHHQHSNAHHWQHWILRNDDGTVKCLGIPHSLVKEMVADWMGAGRAITGRWEVAEWYVKNREVIQLHGESRELANALIEKAQ